jgi:hypothetical protein
MDGARGADVGPGSRYRETLIEMSVLMNAALSR